jgi:hypothetical protein
MIEQKINNKQIVIKNKSVMFSPLLLIITQEENKTARCETLEDHTLSKKARKTLLNMLFVIFTKTFFFFTKTISEGRTSLTL